MSSNKEWEIVQEKAFTAWLNSVLEKVNMKVTDVTQDLSDGVKLIAFLELVSGKKLGKKYDNDPKSRIQAIQNLHLALLFVENQLQVKLLGVGAEEFVDNNKKMILGFLWTLFRKFRIAVISEGDKSSEEGLLAWCKKTTDGYQGVHITTFRNGFHDGFAFLALVHKFAPELFDYNAHVNDDPKNRLTMAFDFAEKEMGIPKLLDPNEVCRGTTDERALVLYTSLFFHAYSAKAERERLERSKNDIANKLAGLESNLESERHTREELLRQKEELEKSKTRLTDTVESHQRQMHELQEKNLLLQTEASHMKETIHNLEAKVNALTGKCAHLEVQLEDYTARLHQQETDYKNQLESLQNKLKETEQELKITLSKLQLSAEENKKKGDAIEENRRRALMETKALLMLKQHLETHVVDMHRFVKVSELEISNFDFASVIKPQILDDLEKFNFEEQVGYLTKKMEEENSQIGKLLEIKENDLKVREKKKEEAKSKAK